MISSTMYNLLGERNSYFIAPSITVIPAQAEIHCGKTTRLQPRAIYRIRYEGFCRRNAPNILGYDRLVT